MDQKLQNNNQEFNFKLNLNSMPFVDESIDNVNKSTFKYIFRYWKYALIFLVGMLTFEILLLIVKTKFLIIYFFPVIAFILGYQFIRNRVRHEFMKQFARTNNFSYDPKGSMYGLDGSFFKIGHSQSVTDVVSGKYKECPMNLFNYKYKVGAGGDSKTFNCTVFELDFDADMPDIMLKTNQDIGFLWGNLSLDNAMEAFQSGRVIVKLEGNFNDYFTLSVEKEYEVEALEIFTPDVMEDLIDKAKTFNLEIINNHLFIFCNKLVGTKDELYALYDLACYFVEKLGPLFARMKLSSHNTKSILN